MSIWRDDLQEALEQIGGQGSLTEIYDSIERIRTKPLPKSWRAIVRRELEYNSSDSDSFQGKHDLFTSVRGIGHGVWAIRGSQQNEMTSIDMPEPHEPERVPTVVHRIVRDTALARRLKALHGDQCQICDHVVRLDDGRSYSEAHHIKPLGTPHNGPDISENIIILCPNHHAMCDFLGIKITSVRQLDGHELGLEFLDYHNSLVDRQSERVF